ncbi:FdhF/YdeP family oxidoreductase [Arenicella xantha]|uniref:Molybdopterin-dependent oxidoreductase alpha subunit n=1 Tax=Arenicella xantha TaxID=644221 RepID=A0A395JMC9_9GAMM|nr:FdhF/YdeP family oxidoreductase [Arenicella xantha]RBP50818.1 molybdopterin-dependent oxidoreductase alpha subunit [Arenicella xantha]
MNRLGKQTVGGGVKKIIYALRTMQRIGLLDSNKALRSNNACKACGLGMGGQAGGMTNEQGDFPSVCNKSIQAQSTDIQPPIPEALFDFTLEDFRALTPHELEHLGRLGSPIYKSAKEQCYRPVEWEWAMQHIVQRFRSLQPERTFFYSSGRSSNEAGFVFQLLARAFGTNNVNNCSYYCHQATSVGLSSTLGTGTATVELADLDLADCIFVIGANPASNHPRFIHKLKACRDRGGQVIVINPAREPGLVKFALPKSAKSLLIGGSEIASHYLQPRIGSDTDLLNGIAKAVFENQQSDQAFIESHTNDFAHYEQQLGSLSWSSIEASTGLSETQIRSVASAYGSSKSAIFAWGMGVTHHLHGVETVEAIASLCLLRGMVGRPGAGLLPLRGHSNVQGMGTIGVKPKLDDTVLAALESKLGIRLPSQSQSPGMDTLACLEAADNNEMDAAILLGGNLLSATPNATWARSALSKVDFKVCLTTTLNASHVDGCDGAEMLILPVAARDEEPEPTTQESMFNYIRLSDGGIQRIASARSETAILAELADGIVDEVDFSSLQSHQAVRELIAETIPGLSELSGIHQSKREFHVANRLKHVPQFNTADGLARFVYSATPSVAALRPFTLMSVRSEGQFNSIIYEEQDSYRGTKDRWTVLLNPKDIDHLGLVEGDKVDITSDAGEMRSVSVYPFDLPRGNAMAYYPEANVLIGLSRDSRSQTPAFKSVAVSIKQTTQK